MIRASWRQVRRLRTETPERRLLLFEALSTSLVYRVALWSLPLRIVLRGRGPLREEGSPVTPEDIEWAVKNASKLVPWSTCLVEALTGRELLGRRGIASEVCFGVGRGEQFEAHAWLDVGGQTLIGGEARGAFAKLPSVIP